MCCHFEFSTPESLTMRHSGQRAANAGVAIGLAMMATEKCFSAFLGRRARGLVRKVFLPGPWFPLLRNLVSWYCYGLDSSCLDRVLTVWQRLEGKHHGQTPSSSKESESRQTPRKRQSPSGKTAQGTHLMRIRKCVVDCRYLPLGHSWEGLRTWARRSLRCESFGTGLGRKRPSRNES